MPPTLDFPTYWPNSLGQVVKNLLASTPTHSPKAQINLGQDVGLSIRNWADRLEPTYTFIQQRYPQVFQVMNQLVKSLPPLNFANPLTVNIGNALADTKFNQLVVFGDSLSDTGTAFSTAFNTLLQGTLGALEQNLGIDLIQVDVFSLVQLIAQRPAEFGLIHYSPVRYSKQHDR
jgi:hypothetical protein